MTIWCNSCKCHVILPCSSHHYTVDNHRGVCKRFRSTKGASKARRDHINSEIRNMRALLPVSQEDRERLSYLHSMAAICTYIRKSVLFRGFPAGQGSSCSLPYKAFLQALHGFILVTTTRGRLVYVSENVAEYLGHSMVDLLQGDTLYDMVECPDIDTVKSNLETENDSTAERSFVCCMNTSKAFRLQHGNCCSMLVRGSFQPLPQPPAASSAARPAEERLFVALCTPTVNRLRSTDSAHLSQSFSSVHRPDMTFTQLSDSVFYFLGYSLEEMSGRSWYSLLHPEDLLSCEAAHKNLMQANEGFQVEMVLRFQRKDLSWTWVYVQATKDSDCQGIRCTNYIVSETEAKFLLQRINSDAFRPSTQSYSCHSEVLQMPQTLGCNLAKCFKRQRTSNSQSEDPSAKRRRESERDICFVACASSRNDGSPVTTGDSLGLFTPPYSPASSNSPLQREELSSDFLMDVHGYADQLLSSPEASPSYYPCPEGHLSPSSSLQAITEQSFDRGAISTTVARSPESSLSPTGEFQACGADARLVPDHLSVPDMCESPLDCALHPEDFGFPEQPRGGGSFQVHHVPHLELSLHSGLLTPNPSPTSQDSFEYNEREQVEISILAQQISSLASSFDVYHTLSPLQNTMQPATETPPSTCDWPQCPAPSTGLPLKPELVLDDSVFDSIMKDLDMVPGKGSTFAAGVVTYSCQQGLTCGRNGSRQSGQEPSGLPASTLVDPLPAEQFTPANIVTDPFTLRLGNHDQNTGLHQLNHYIYSGLQQDGLVEETLY